MGDPAGVDDRHAIRDGERLFLVVRDIDGGESELLAQPPDLGAHLNAQAGIEVGEGLIEKKAARAHHQYPCQSHPLLLAPGEFVDPGPTNWTR